MYFTINTNTAAHVKSILRVMEMTDSDLSRCAKLSQHEVVELRGAAARAILRSKPSLTTAADLLKAEGKDGSIGTYVCTW